MPVDRFQRLRLGLGLTGTDVGDGVIEVAASGGGHVIADEGAALAARATLNFAGAGVTATDDSANNRTTVTVPAGVPGPAGPQGDPGPQGPAGEGVPTGGSAGQVLTKDTTTDYDTSWQTPAAGGGMELIQAIRLSAAGQFTFSSIPQTYQRLILKLVAKGTLAEPSATANVYARFNGSASGYSHQMMWSEGTAVNAASGDRTEGFLGVCPDVNGLPGNLSAEVGDYARGGQNKTWLGASALQRAGVGVRLFNHGGIWYATGAAITSLLLFCGDTPPFNYAAGSIASLYGLK
jgi:hypothetical protein